MIVELVKGLNVVLLLAAAADQGPEKLLLTFAVNPAADGRTDDCVFVQAWDINEHELIDFRPSAKFIATACDDFLVLRRKMLRPGDAESFMTWSEHALWLRTDPDVPQPVTQDAL